MSDMQAGPQSGRFATKVTADCHFSRLQTRLALENATLTWIHTAVTMIGFGFAIVQFFDHLHELPGGRAALLPNAPWLLGYALIICGVLVLVTVLWKLPEDAPLSEERNICVDRAFVGLRKHAPVYTVAIVLTLFGIFAVLLHLV